MYWIEMVQVLNHVNYDDMSHVSCEDYCTLARKMHRMHRMHLYIHREAQNERTTVHLTSYVLFNVANMDGRIRSLCSIDWLNCKLADIIKYFIFLRFIKHFLKQFRYYI